MRESIKQEKLIGLVGKAKKSNLSLWN